MRIPQVNDRVKEAPAQVLRAVFAGIGQLMSTADKIRNKPASAEAPATPKPAEPAAPEPAAPETAAQETVAPEPVAPEPVAPEPVAAEPAPMASVATEPVVSETAPPETATPETVTPPPAVPKMVPPEPALPEVKPEAPVTSSGGHVRLLPPDEVPAAAAAAGQLPLPNYDDLSVASLRARLRNLSADQISQLIDYEKGHAGRADVITMFERRIAKLAEG
jgi:hypothetical protein